MKAIAAHHGAEEFLQYLEDLLSPEERVIVDRHLRECGLCSRRLKEIELFVSLITTYRTTVFCPHPSELYEFAETGTDKQGKFVDHVPHCESCREDLSMFLDAYKEQFVEMPWGIRQAFEDHCSLKARRVRFSDITSSLSKFRRVPEWAKFRYGAYAAALIIIVTIVGAYFYTSEEMKPVLGVSSVTWKPTGYLQLMAPAPDVEKPRVAIMLYIKDFKRPPDQHKLDAWYKAMAPDARLRQWLDFVNPAEVKEAADRTQEFRLVQIEREAQLMGNCVGASEALVLTITSQGDQFEIQGDLTDVKTGKALRKAATVKATDADLGIRLREAAFSVLERGNP